MAQGGLGAPNGSTLQKGKSKLMKPDSEQDSVSDILKKNKRQIQKKPKGKGRRDRKGSKGTKATRNNKRKDKKGKKGSSKASKAKATTHSDGLEEKEEIDPYLLLKESDSQALIRMFIHKLVQYPSVSEHLGSFGHQLQSSMINFASDMVLPTLMSSSHLDRFQSIINDRKLVYLLRQSFIRWLQVHRGQMKLVFKRKGDENAQNKLKYDVVVTKNHIIQKLSSTLATSSSAHDVKDIISKLSLETKSSWLHFLRSDIKNPFLAQLQTAIPSSLLPNTGCKASINKENENDDKKDDDDDKKEEEQGDVIARLHSVFSGYKECVLLSEKQVLVDILKTQYKLIQNAIDDYGKIRWMDAPIDAGHIALMQRELMKDHSDIMRKCTLIENDFKTKLEENISEVNKMRAELEKRNNIYLHLIDKKCFKFLRYKLSAIHEEIERKKQAIALHEKKRENYLNHAKESLKNEQNMRKGVDLVQQTYHKYLRQLTKSKVEYAVIDEELQSDSFYNLQEKLNILRNQNDRYWYWFKKEKEIYSKSIKAFSRLNRFFKNVEEFLIKEYGESSSELMAFRTQYYTNVMYNNVEQKELNNEYNREIFGKKKITDIEIVYNMKKKDIKLPPHNFSVVNRLYKRMQPMMANTDVLMDMARRGGRRKDEKGMFLNNKIQKDKENEEEQYKELQEAETDENRKQRRIDEEERNKNVHLNDSDEDEEEEEDEGEYYTKTSDHEIFGDTPVYDEDDSEFEDDEDDNDEMSYGEIMQSASKVNVKRSSINSVDSATMQWGDALNDPRISAAPLPHAHHEQNYSLMNVDPNEQHLLYEDSKQYQQDDEDEDDRPSSTIFKNDVDRNTEDDHDDDDGVFFSESHFFDDDNDDKSQSQSGSDDDHSDDDDEVLQVSGFAKIKTTNITNINEQGTPEYVEDDDDDEEYSFEDDDDDDDMDDDEFEDDDDDEDSYEDSSE